MPNPVVHELAVFEPSVFPSTTAAKQADRRLALAAVCLSTLVFVAAVPFARWPLPAVWPFIPAYESALIICDLITAGILFTQFSILRLRALLVLACGYLFTALIAVAHMITFPGLFSPTGLLGAGPQSTAWLYMFWHGGFPISVVIYALLKNDSRRVSPPYGSPRSAFFAGVAGVVAAVAALTALATIGQGFLPVILYGNSYSPLMIFVVSATWLLGALACLALWLRRPHTVLDLWLSVVMCAWMFDIALSAVLNAGRFDVGFYVGRIYGLLAATFVLLILLLETGVLYARLAQLHAAERRERNREVEARRRIFDIAPELILVTDSRGTFVRVSSSAATLLGYEPEEMIGHSAAEFVYSDDLEPTRNEMRLARSSRQTRSFETRYVHKDGRIVTLAWTGGWSEAARQYSFIGRDMTELLESEQMARAIIDTALDAFLQLDESGTITAWSFKTEEMFGWSRQEIVGHKLHDFIIPPANRDAYQERIAQFLHDAANGIPGRRYEAPSLRRDGTQFMTEVSLTALRRRGGYVINCFVRDVTQKIAAEEQLRQAQKMETVGQLTGGIAHDFNNMLTVITGTIDILGEAVADKPELAAVAKLISEAADRGAELTGHLLAFARKQPLQPRETDVNALIMDSLKLLRPALGEHIEIETSLKSDVSPALVDPGQLTSSLMNLAVNARDAMPNGGKLTLETSNVVLDQNYVKANADVQAGNYVLIAVSDTGAGIPAAVRDKVFEPFFTTKEVGKGTGLGLSMVYGFIKQSGGHIKVYSEVGHGTTFKLYLPLAGAHIEAKATPSSDSETRASGETILVVEDDQLVRANVIAQLTSLGYHTLSAANAADALAMADDGAQFDLLFTDLIMPGKMNGRQLAEEMAKRRSSLKVLFTSGYTENAIIHHGRLDPGVLLLAKPYRKLDLARMLRTALGTDGGSPGAAREAVRARAV